MQYIFYLPGVLFLISGFPQIIKLIKTKSSEDISTSMYLITFLAVLLVVIDAFVHHNKSLMVSNLVSLITMGVTIFLVIKYKKKPSYAKAKDGQGNPTI